MIKATKEFLESIDSLTQKRINEILNAKDCIKIEGTVYYVSNSGDDDNDGKSPDTPWQSLDKVNDAELKPGDGVFFKRGDLFRGAIWAKAGVTYAAYGEGPKPKLYSGSKDFAQKDLWELFDKEHNIWKLKEETRDMGAIVFNDGEEHTRKMIPSFKNYKFVCRDNPDVEFDMRKEMTQDLDLYWLYKGPIIEEGGVPVIPYEAESLGELYLRCDRGNPGEVFRSAEALLRLHAIRTCGHGVTVDNFCIKYVGAHGVSGGGQVNDLTITNCEFGWIGGAIQNFNRYAANPERKGVIVRYGNAIEIYGGCSNYIAHNNYIYEVYDAGITHQVSSTKKLMHENIEYSDNVIERCVYGIEYFLGQSGEEKGKIKDTVIKNNIIRFSGYGWGRQRYNPDTPAAVKSWNSTNLSENFVFKDNIFDRSTAHFMHICALTNEDCPVMDGNTYIQNLNGPLGKFGAVVPEAPKRLTYDMDAEKNINTVFGDKNAKVYYIEE